MQYLVKKSTVCSLQSAVCSLQMSHTVTEVTRIAKYTEVYFDQFQKHYMQNKLSIYICKYNLARFNRKTSALLKACMEMN